LVHAAAFRVTSGLVSTTLIPVSSGPPALARVKVYEIVSPSSASPSPDSSLNRPSFENVYTPRALNKVSTVSASVTSAPLGELASTTATFTNCCASTSDCVSVRSPSHGIISFGERTMPEKSHPVRVSMSSSVRLTATSDWSPVFVISK